MRQNTSVNGKQNGGNHYYRTEKRMERDEDGLRDPWYNNKCTNTRLPKEKRERTHLKI